MEPVPAPSELAPPDPASPAIRLREVTKRFRGADHDAVSALSLDIPRGAIVALIGPSGCGKTTTLRMINRLIEPTSGTIEIEGRDIADEPLAPLRRGIGYVIQQVGLFPHRTISQNIATVPRSLGWDKARTAARIDELVALVGLDPGMLSRYPDELSGGQQQRVGVARALAADPPVLLMDEPFGAVDPIVRARLQDELLKLQELVHKTIVIVTHDIDEAIKLGDRVALLNVGGIVEQYAPPDEMLAAPASEFVERFVGQDRASKRLGLASVAELGGERGPVVDLEATVDEARAAMAAHLASWLGVVDDGVFLGWIDGEEIHDGVALSELPHARPAAQVQPDSTLREAMEIIMTSRTSVAVIDDDGRFGGVVTLEQIRAYLADGVREPVAVSGLLALPLASDPNALVRWEYITGQWDDIQAALVTHILLTVYTIAIGLVIAAALAALALRYGWATGPITGFTGFLYTIPSVALFGLLTPYTGYSKTTALIALVGYSLLILFTNIVAGFRAVPHAVLDAADGMGMSSRTRLLSVQLPLALPYIITGLRIATVTTVGIITVASIIGQGGLGDLILDGLRRTYWSPMVVGAVLSVVLALLLDLLIFLIGRVLTPWSRTRRWAS